jgi:hypothetical protein
MGTWFLEPVLAITGPTSKPLRVSFPDSRPWLEQEMIQAVAAGVGDAFNAAGIVYKKQELDPCCYERNHAALGLIAFSLSPMRRRCSIRS